MNIVHNRDCLAVMAEMQPATVDLILADIPYNIGKAEWDRWPTVDDYLQQVRSWLSSFSRVLKPNGSLYVFHSDMAQFSRILADAQSMPLVLNSFLVLYKRGFRARMWAQPSDDSVLRCWFPVCEYAAEFFAKPGVKTAWDTTGPERIYSDPSCFRPLKDWYRSELQRLGLTQTDVLDAYRTATGRNGYMLRHYFQDSQFEIPTEAVWTSVYEPLGFGLSYSALRAQYEALRNYHRPDLNHCNVIEIGGSLAGAADAVGWHPTAKPVSLYHRLIRTSCRPGGLVFDPFLGSGSSRIAAHDLGFDFIGCEIDPEYYAQQEAWYSDHSAQANIFLQEGPINGEDPREEIRRAADAAGDLSAGL